MSNKQQTPETTHTPHTWERKLGYEIISWDGFRALKNTDLITETDFRERAVHTTQNLLSPAQQIYRLTAELHVARAEATEAKGEVEKFTRLFIGVCDAIGDEKGERLFENAKKIVGEENDTLRAELATLRATRDADHGAAIELRTALIETIGALEMLSAFYRHREPWKTCGVSETIREAKEVAFATVTNSQQKGGEQRVAPAAPQPATAKEATVRIPHARAVTV